MFARGRLRRHPRKRSSTGDGCKLLLAGPGVEIPWNEVRTRYWEARCVCGVGGWHAPAVFVGTTHTTRRPPAT